MQCFVAYVGRWAFVFADTGMDYGSVKLLVWFAAESQVVAYAECVLSSSVCVCVRKRVYNQALGVRMCFATKSQTVPCATLVFS